MKILTDLTEVMPGCLWFYLINSDRDSQKCYFLKVVQVQEKVSTETAEQELIAFITTGRHAQRLTVQDGGHTHTHTYTYT